MSHSTAAVTFCSWMHHGLLFSLLSHVSIVLPRRRILTVEADPSRWHLCPSGLHSFHFPFWPALTSTFSLPTSPPLPLYVFPKRIKLGRPFLGLPRWLMVRNLPANQYRRLKGGGFDPWVRKIPWRRAWQPTPVFLPGESHGQRSLVGYSPWGHKESDRTETAEHTLMQTFPWSFARDCL